MMMARAGLPKTANLRVQLPILETHSHTNDSESMKVGMPHRWVLLDPRETTCDEQLFRGKFDRKESFASLACEQTGIVSPLSCVSQHREALNTVAAS